MNKVIVLLIACTLLIGIFSGCSKDEHDMFTSLYGVVTDRETGEPVANASVVLSPGGKTKITGSDGNFEFNDLDPQQYTVTVQKSGYQTNRKTVTAVVGEKVEANIPLAKTE